MIVIVAHITRDGTMIGVINTDSRLDAVYTGITRYNTVIGAFASDAVRIALTVIARESTVVGTAGSVNSHPTSSRCAAVARSSVVSAIAIEYNIPLPWSLTVVIVYGVMVGACINAYTMCTTTLDNVAIYSAIIASGYLYPIIINPLNVVVINLANIIVKGKANA